MTRSSACFVIVMLLSTHADANGAFPRIRTGHPAIAAALAEGDERSSTFARLTARIRQSDLIVHVLPANKPGPQDGTLHFVTSAGNVRYVRIRVRVYPQAATLIALLAHELMHAVEIADAPAVPDGNDLKALYARIGYCSDPRRADVFDSATAVDAGRQVLGELQGVSTK